MHASTHACAHASGAIPARTEGGRPELRTENRALWIVLFAAVRGGTCEVVPASLHECSMPSSFPDDKAWCKGCCTEDLPVVIAACGHWIRWMPGKHANIVRKFSCRNFWAKLSWAGDTLPACWLRRSPCASMHAPQKCSRLCLSQPQKRMHLRLPPPKNCTHLCLSTLLFVPTPKV